jgi:hypothetical protein
MNAPIWVIRRLDSETSHDSQTLYHDRTVYHRVHASTSPGQHPGTPDPAQRPAPAGLIWTRPPKEQRERPTREAIVAAATGLADTRGLDAVSIRRIAATRGSTCNGTGTQD